ncbi:carboxypeptidase-like regulatory domain-containing protein [Nocardia sp. N13]|uniref:carboxypeptidase-like regulatory domain-containing protein n=1 Tax=Nocardioides sp. N13(2025) TaxID=3453405 RepID=UPI003F76B231
MNNTFRRAAGALLATGVGISSAVIVTGAADAAPPIRINGSVVAAAGGAPLANISVIAVRIADGVVAGSARTGLDGSWNMLRPADGTYTIRFDDPAGTYATEWYNDKSTLETADLVDFNEGQKSDLGQTDLGSAAHLTGVVTGSTGTGIEGAEVTAYVRQSGAWASFVTVSTGANGAYDVGGLPGGTYKLGFHDPATDVGEYWNNQADLAAADELQVAKDGTTTGLNAQLATPVPTPTPTDTPTTTPTTTTPTTTTAPVNTAAPAATASAVTVAVRPRIKGIAKVAKTLRVTKGTWTPTTVTKKIQWLANGKRIKGATKAKLLLTKKLVGKRISVRVIASAPGLTKLKVTTKRTKKVRR